MIHLSPRWGLGCGGCRLFVSIDLSPRWGFEEIRAIKQGMMQQLLTGRVRLVKPKRYPEIKL